MAPKAMSSFTRPGPSSTSTRTASTSHSPAPAFNVSARWRSVESGSSDNTAATPPCAQRVADCTSSALVSTPSRIPGSVAARTAAERPATPLPRTRRSRFRAGSGLAGDGVTRASQVEDVEGAVLVVDMHDDGLEAVELGVLVIGVGDDDDLVARVHEPRRSTVQLHLAGLTEDGGRREAGGGGDVGQRDLLPLGDC